MDIPTRRDDSGNRWSMYPSLHDDVTRLLEDDGLYLDFHKRDNAKGCIKDYDTNIMGKFTCCNNACGNKGWSSKEIAITIRMYSGGRYNARVYHQRCQRCNTLSRPVLDDSYAERVAYRIKKWRGVQMNPPDYSGESDGPHRKELCEGCKAGHCSAVQH
jgi:hypothetical protein